MVQRKRTSMQRGFIGVFCMLSVCSAFICSPNAVGRLVRITTSPISSPLQHAALPRMPAIMTAYAKKDDFNSLDKNSIDPKRFVVFNLLALLLAIGANFLGVTSWLLTASHPDTFRQMRADIVYPIQGYQRYYDAKEGFEFIYPFRWQMDPRIMLAQQRQRELPSALQQQQLQKKTQNAVLPCVAYGPIDSQFKENVSVIKSKVQKGFSLEATLGTPSNAAQKLLQTSIAPVGSGKVATLLDAHEEIRGNSNSYVLEYLLDKEDQSIHQHTISIIQNNGEDLYTFTATVPESQWNKEKAVIDTIEKSFKLSKME